MNDVMIYNKLSQLGGGGDLVKSAVYSHLDGISNKLKQMNGAGSTFVYNNYLVIYNNGYVLIYKGRNLIKNITVSNILPEFSPTTYTSVIPKLSSDGTKIVFIFKSINGNFQIKLCYFDMTNDSWVEKSSVNPSSSAQYVLFPDSIEAVIPGVGIFFRYNNGSTHYIAYCAMDSNYNISTTVVNLFTGGSNGFTNTSVSYISTVIEYGQYILLHSMKSPSQVVKILKTDFINYYASTVTPVAVYNVANTSVAYNMNDGNSGTNFNHYTVRCQIFDNILLINGWNDVRFVDLTTNIVTIVPFSNRTDASAINFMGSFIYKGKAYGVKVNKLSYTLNTSASTTPKLIYTFGIIDYSNKRILNYTTEVFAEYYIYGSQSDFPFACGLYILNDNIYIRFLGTSSNTGSAGVYNEIDITGLVDKVVNI